MFGGVFPLTGDVVFCKPFSSFCSLYLSFWDSHLYGGWSLAYFMARTGSFGDCIVNLRWKNARIGGTHIME